jgi:hypothetical protein
MQEERQGPGTCIELVFSSWEHNTRRQCLWPILIQTFPFSERFQGVLVGLKSGWERKWQESTEYISAAKARTNPSQDSASSDYRELWTTSEFAKIWETWSNKTINRATLITRSCVIVTESVYYDKPANQSEDMTKLLFREFVISQETSNRWSE